MLGASVVLVKRKPDSSKLWLFRLLPLASALVVLILVLTQNKPTSLLDFRATYPPVSKRAQLLQSEVQTRLARTVSLEELQNSSSSESALPSPLNENGPGDWTPEFAYKSAYLGRAWAKRADSMVLNTTNWPYSTNPGLVTERPWPYRYVSVLRPAPVATELGRTAAAKGGSYHVDPSTLHKGPKPSHFAMYAHSFLDITPDHAVRPYVPLHPSTRSLDSDEVQKIEEEKEAAVERAAEERQLAAREAAVMAAEVEEQAERRRRELIMAPEEVEAGPAAALAEQEPAEEPEPGAGAAEAVRTPLDEAIARDLAALKPADLERVLDAVPRRLLHQASLSAPPPRI